MEQAANNPVVIVDYNPLWPKQFDTLRSRLANVLGGFALTIEQVGSTAVPGLAAKPIIDIDVLLRSPDDLALAIAALASIGYQHRGDLGIAGREAFRAPAGDPRHHLYVCPNTTKRELARKFGDDREAYNNAKREFVESILRESAKEKAVSKLAVSSPNAAP